MQRLCIRQTAGLRATQALLRKECMQTRPKAEKTTRSKCGSAFTVRIKETMGKLGRICTGIYNLKYMETFFLQE